MVKITGILLMSLFISSCSLFGIQKEEGPDYKVLDKRGDFEVREYSSYIIAKVTVTGDYDNSSGEAFRILAGYIFGKNKGQKDIAMTAPVQIEKKSEKIAMTSPVVMSQSEGKFTMSFSMPKEYTLESLPEALDSRIIFEKVESHIIGSHKFSGLSSRKKNNLKAKELRDWIRDLNKYKLTEGHLFAGYNPPWTLPFLKRNEVHIRLNK